MVFVRGHARDFDHWRDEVAGRQPHTSHPKLQTARPEPTVLES
jgi:hypothetical protein